MEAWQVQNLKGMPAVWKPMEGKRAVGLKQAGPEQEELYFGMNFHLGTCT